MIRAWLFAAYALLATVACGASLAREPVVRPKLEILLNPRIVLEGGSVWVTCRVPEELSASRVRYGIEGIRTSEGPLEHIQNRLLVERIPCGAWVASCAISTGERASEVLEVRGDCE